MHRTSFFEALTKGNEAGAIYATTTALNGGTTLVPVSTLGERVEDGDFTANKLPDDSSRDKNDIRFVQSNEWNENGRVKNFTEVGKNSLALITDGIKEPYHSTLYYTDSVYLKAGQ